MIEVAMLAFACFVVGAIAGAITTLIMAAVVAGGRADDEMEEWHRNRRKE